MTVKGYEEHVDLHILPFIGAKKLSDLTVPAIHDFADQLATSGRSAEMIKRVVRSLGGIFKEARRRGLSNVAPTVGLDLDLPDERIHGRSFRQSPSCRRSLRKHRAAGAP